MYKLFSCDKDGTNPIFIPTEKKLPIYSNGSYQQLQVTHNGTRYVVLLHRLVATLYVPNIGCKTQVNHIDGNKLNNSYTNLEWVTPKENTQHAITTGLKSTFIYNVYNYTQDLVYTGTVQELATAFGSSIYSINSAIYKQISHKGFIICKGTCLDIPIKIQPIIYLGKVYYSSRELSRASNVPRRSLYKLDTKLVENLTELQGVMSNE